MTNQKRKDQDRYKVRSGRLYEYAKNLANESLSIERKGKTLEELYGIEKAGEMKKNMKTRKTRSSPTAEERENLGRAVSESWKRNTGPRGFQIKQPIKISCPRCGKTMDKGNYTKYQHGVSCS